MRVLTDGQTDRLISVDSGYFTQPVVIRKDHGQMLIKSVQHSNKGRQTVETN